MVVKISLPFFTKIQDKGKIEVVFYVSQAECITFNTFDNVIYSDVDFSTNAPSQQ